MSKPKIFVYRAHSTHQDAAGVAFAEDGDELAWHISSGPDWFRHDMGLTGTWKHDLYAAKYPDGYELVEVIGIEAIKAHIASGALRNVSFSAGQSEPADA